MTVKQQRLAVAFLVAIHMLLLLAYTLPQAMVPAGLLSLGQRYTRPLFHQQWLLFAPDPPLCSCQVQVGSPHGVWQPVMPPGAPYLRERMARPLADHVQEQIAQGDTILMPILEQALRNMSRDLGLEGDALRFRSVERCIVNVDRPGERTSRTTVLRTAVP
jgi:hypothetical protein